MGNYNAPEESNTVGRANLPLPRQDEDATTVGRLRGLLIDLAQNQDQLRKEIEGLEETLYPITQHAGGVPEISVENCSLPGDSDVVMVVCDAIQRTVHTQQMVRCIRNSLDI